MTEESQNSLSSASSAYLRSAMHQPIQWHEWGEEAFATRKRENKPILLDIGAVWCHWCHVMDRESYDNPEIAQIVNEHFMASESGPRRASRRRQPLSGCGRCHHGTRRMAVYGISYSRRQAFYGGTYFPPEDQYGRPSFKRVLLSNSEAYREKTHDVV